MNAERAHETIPAMRVVIAEDAAVLRELLAQMLSMRGTKWWRQ